MLQLVPAAGALALGGAVGPASAVQGLTAGRIPGDLRCLRFTPLPTVFI